jgi:plastocyanin
VDEMNFSYGLIAIVGVLAAISIVFIAMDPEDIIEPRVIVDENPIACTMQWDPMCGVDGETYGNMCMLDAADVKLDYQGECMVKELWISVHSSIMLSIATVGEVLLIEVEFTDDDGNIVDHVNYDIFTIQDGNAILSEPGSHRHPGKHPIHETAVLSESEIKIKVIIQGLGHGDEITGPTGIENMMTITPEVTTKPETTTPETTTPETTTPETTTPESLPMTGIVSIPPGSAVPGCENTNECYLPFEINVAVGATVSWINDDSAPHTVTSGTVPIADGLFDSGIVMSGSVYEFTFDEAGTYDYFCMVHPWMTGKVLVN